MHYLTSALDGGEWSASRPGRFTPRERVLGTHWIGGWVGSRAILDVVVKRKIPSSHWKSDPRTPIVQLLTGLLDSQTFGRTPWLGDQSNARPLLKQRTTQRNTNTDTHPCPKQDLNLQSRCSSGRRQYMP
jgi:hypothetical protein